MEISFYTVKLLFCKGLITCPVATFLQLKTRTMERNEERKFRKDNAPENCMLHMNTFGSQMSLCFLICVYKERGVLEDQVEKSLTVGLCSEGAGLVRATCG